MYCSDQLSLYVGLINCFRHGYSNKHKSYNEGEYETLFNIFYPREKCHKKKKKQNKTKQTKQKLKYKPKKLDKK